MLCSISSLRVVVGNGVIKNPFMSQMSKKRFIDWLDFAILASLMLPRPKLLKIIVSIKHNW